MTITFTYYNTHEVGLADVQAITEALGYPTEHIDIDPMDELQIKLEEGEYGAICRWYMADMDRLDSRSETRYVIMKGIKVIHLFDFHTSMKDDLQKILHQLFLAHGGWVLDDVTENIKYRERRPSITYTLDNVDQFLSNVDW